jgi:hypothetical protein
MEASKTQPWHHAVFESRSLSAIGAAQIDTIKAKAAELLAEIDSIKATDEVVTAGKQNESLRLVALAKKDLESTVMWAVKAISRT